MRGFNLLVLVLVLVGNFGYLSWLARQVCWLRMLVYRVKSTSEYIQKPLVGHRLGPHEKNAKCRVSSYYT